MNELLYNKIITKISKIVKKSINEAYSENSIYDRIYTSFKELKILNDSGLLGDILQINDFGGFRVISKSDVNESALFDIELLDKDHDITDEIFLWKDFAICLGTGLWSYLDWIGLHKEFKWAKDDTPLYMDNKQTSKNGYENTLNILNKYDVTGTLWEEVLKCKYPVFIPSINELLKIYDQYSLLSSCPKDEYWSSSLQHANPHLGYGYAFQVDFSYGLVNCYVNSNKCRSIALLHFL